MKLKYVSVFFISISILFYACKNPFYADNELKNGSVSPGFCVITAQTDSTAGRYAVPESLGSVKYYAAIKAPGGKYLTDIPSQPVSSQVTYLENKASAPALRFLFIPHGSAGDYVITVYAFSDAAGTVPSLQNYKAKAVTVKVLPADTVSIDLGHLRLQGNTGSDAPKGTVDTPISIPSGVRISLDVTRQGGTLPADEGFDLVDMSGSFRIRHKGTGITPGIYTIRLTAYESGSGTNQVFLQNPVQTVTVFSGCETKTWYGIDGKPFTGALTIEKIDNNAVNTFYVNGTGGSLADSFTPKDTNTGTTLISPLKTLNAALAKCTGTGTYTIYVDGAVIETDPQNQNAISGKVTLKSLSTRAAVKKETGFTKSLVRIGSGGHLVLENIVLDGADINSVNYGGLIYNSGTLTLKTDTELTSGAAQLGGGAVYNAGTLNIEGSAKIPLSTGIDENKNGKNDIYLATGKFITVTGLLNPVGGISARITPDAGSEDDYAKDTVLVKKASAAAVNLNDYERSFLLTPTSYSEWELYGSSDELKTVRGAVTSWKGLKKAVNQADSDGSITVKGTLKATNEQDNSGEILIGKNLTIKGESETSIGILDANSNHGSSPPADAPAAPHRIFKVESGKTLTLQNLTLKNGKEERTDRSEGGAVYVDGGELVVKDCIIRDCKAAAETPQGKAYGGAVYMKGGKAFFRGNTQIIQCAVKGAQDSGDAGGGAVYIGEGAEVTMRDNSLIQDCKAECEVQVRGEGGGAAVIKGTFTMQDGSKITGCIADGVGGAIYGRNFNGDKGTIVIKGNSEVSGNTAQKSGISGGGIYSAHELTVSDSALISGNNSPHGNGGGIAVSGNCDFSGGTVKNNTVSSPGGLGSGIYIGGGSSGSIHFNMSGTAHIEDSNDIYLINNKKITLTGSLSHSSGIAGRITPKNYTAGNQILAADTGVILANEAGKFRVTPENLSAGGTQAWTIDSQGKLYTYTQVSYTNLDSYLQNTASTTEVNYIKITDIDASQLTGSFSNPSSLGQKLKDHSDKKFALELPETVANNTGMSGCFQNCTNLVSIKNIPDGVTDMQGCFAGCTQLTSVPAIPQGVMNMENCFYDCRSLTSVPAIPKGVTDMRECFFRCSNLMRVRLNCDYIMGNFTDTFYECNALLDGGIEVKNEYYYNYTQDSALNSMHLPPVGNTVEQIKKFSKF